MKSFNGLSHISRYQRDDSILDRVMSKARSAVIGFETVLYSARHSPINAIHRDINRYARFDKSQHAPDEELCPWDYAPVIPKH